MSVQPWKRLEPTTETKGTYRSIITKTFQRKNGEVQGFDTFDREHIQHAGVIAVTREHKVVIARQFRPGPEMVMEEIPGGTLEANEDPLEAASRECSEETGYKVGAIEYLGKVRKDAYMNATWHYFLATDCELTAVGQHLDDREEIEIVEISIEKLFQNAYSGLMTDTDAVLLAYEKLKALEGTWQESQKQS